MSWSIPFESIKYVTVEDMYKNCNLPGFPARSLLTGGELNNLPRFMNVYKVKWPYFDREFNNRYRNSYFFNQKGYKEITSNEIGEVEADFAAAVISFCWLNEKKYNELFRVDEVDDELYSIIDNYDVTETREGEGSKSITDVFGNRIVNGQESTGAQTNTRQDQANTGAQTNTMTGEVAPYDSDTFSNNDKSTQSLGARQDSSSSSTSLGARQDSSTTTYGAHTDNHTVDDSDSYTLTKKGNIGVQTQSEVMQKHVNFWKSFSFYARLFEDINREYLLFYRAYL